MKATRKQLEAAAAKHEAEIEYDFACTGIAVFAPEGLVWSETGCSMIVMEAHAGWTGKQSWKPQAYAQLIEAMEAGLMPE
jgi:hypothetical protein